MPIKPPALVIAVFNTHCNYACTFCANRIHKAGCKMWSFDQIKSLDTLWQGINIANVGGVGEMSIIPYFEDVLKYFHDRHVQICFTSNGYLLNPNMVRQYNSIFEIVISLHSLKPEIYNRLTGTQGRLDQVIQHIRELAVRPRSYRFIIVSVVTNINVQESEALAQFVVDVGADEMRFLPLADHNLVGLPAYDSDIPLQETSENMACLSQAKAITKQAGCLSTNILKLDEREAVVKQKMTSCPNPWEQCVVTIEGEVLPCCFIHHVFGNLFQQPWEEIWNSDAYNKFRDEVRAGTSELCLKNCKNWG